MDSILLLVHFGTYVFVRDGSRFICKMSPLVLVPHFIMFNDQLDSHVDGGLQQRLPTDICGWTAELGAFWSSFVFLGDEELHPPTDQEEAAIQV